MTADLMESWAFRLAVPMLGFLVTALIGVVAWMWNRLQQKLDVLELRSTEQQRDITRLETIAEASRGRDGQHVSREVLDLTVKPITDRLDGIEEQITAQTNLLGDLMRALAHDRPSPPNFRTS